ncbi:transcription cofactor vestigial-like protein 4 [Microcaecilia unicolor]|uniref:Transcription cofactor vestigial-like protein 4 n=1 Tax=Microcaecilia unicolor TaxID=1415580 RepID=A0A6P7XB64_9AMPH|nr:transcription cofactor vestigial-like protein 4 [Microcaecilia unicolor]
MAVADFHYTTGISSGFKVYILEGQPSLKSEERFHSLSSHRIPIYPVKRKLSPERRALSRSLESRALKMRRSPSLLSVDTPHSCAKLRDTRPNSADVPMQSHLQQMTLEKALHHLLPHRICLSTTQPQASLLPCHGSKESRPQQSSDEPLELTKKNHSMTTPDSATTRSLPAAILQQMRPSVITCVSNQNKTSLKQPHNVPQTENTSAISCQQSNKTGCRISTLNCDPGVEEHFLRSLGRRYAALDSAHSFSTASCVDDHFSKALGSSWLLIRSTPSSPPSSPTRQTTDAS